jgi:LysR family transcriptional activator of nhaA
MDGLNYHHLLYFWKVVKTGSIAKASAELKLTQPTISEQIRLLEASLDRKLFNRAGRSLVLTETGEKVFGYAQKIFALGGELTDSLRGVERRARPTFRVGVEKGIPESIVATLLAPALRVMPRPLLELRHDTPEALLRDLSAGRITVALTASASHRKPGNNHAHLLSQCGTLFLVAQGKKSISKKWPDVLGGRPFLLPNSRFGEELQAWFRSKNISPEIAARSDSAKLLRSLADLGFGFFALPNLKGQDLSGLTVLGRTNDVRSHFYAITRERVSRDPYVAAMLAGGKRKRA